MDTRLKSHRKLRTILTILFLAALTAGNLMLFPGLAEQAEQFRKETGQPQEEQTLLDEESIRTFYYGCYVLYAQSFRESLQEENRTTAFENGGTCEIPGAWDLRAFFPGGIQEVNDASQLPTASSLAGDFLSEWDAAFWNHINEFDYYAETRDQLVQTNSPGIGRIVTEIHNAENGYADRAEQQIEDRGYRRFFVFSFDEYGNMTIQFYTDDAVCDERTGEIMTYLADEFVYFHQQNNLQKLLVNELGMSEGNAELAETGYEPIRNYNVYYGIPEGSSLLFTQYYIASSQEEMELVCLLPYILSAVAVAVWMVIMTSRFLWKDIRTFHRRGKWYVAEAGIFGVICSVCMFSLYVSGLDFFDRYQLQQIPGLWPFQYADFAILRLGILLAAVLYAVFTVMYLSLHCFRPLFSLGIVEYVRQYSLIRVVCVWLWGGFRRFAKGSRQRWRDFRDEIRHLDFTQKPTKIILKIVLINFAVLVLLMCFWFLGLIGLVIYSLGLFFLMKRYFERVSEDYRKLSAAMSKMASGDLSEPKTEDMGVFNPMQQELTEIRSGFRRAVDQEVKSQKMKTELITNVSHDLKTPLTAITTYVELLKKPDITEEERAAYIETLERKSLRLKILIEDLFEVSKAQSENVSLELMNVDLVNLMRQVAVEHEDHFRKKQIELRWRLPEEKVVLLLDNQKTYRIFENLFINIEKYAMPGSRVYVEVARKEDSVRVVMKNISAAELNVAPEELTERFVRGDKSRNTEGSGLGLAIARSFTELQKGEFQVEVDGDLFKVTLVWKK